VIRILAAAIVFLSMAASGSAQPSRAPSAPLPAVTAAAAAASSEPGSQLTVYLLTMGPGDEVWEKFGHNAIWIHDAANGTDIAYHWGLFDFADKEFLPRFIQGRMRYSMGAFDMLETIDAYRQANRTVWAQELNLTTAQRQRLAEFVAWNIRPENRFYRYDYFRDNCSTRVRDAIDMALSGVIRREAGRSPSGTTYRFHTERLTQDDWPVFTGTMMGLGEPVDRPITAWEEMFLPVRLMDRLRSMRVVTPNGSSPLVTNERVVFQATRPPEDVTVRRGVSGYILVSTGLLAIGIGLWLSGWRGGRRSVVLSLAAVWSLVAGIAGTLLAGLWGFTDHVYSYDNENVLQLNPLSFILALLLIRMIWKRHRSSTQFAPRVTMYFAFAVAALSLIGFIIQVLPSMNQGNGEVIALTLPLHLGVFAAVLAIVSQRAQRIEPT